MPLFFVSAVTAILPVYTTSKLHAARQTPSSTPGVFFQLSKRAWFLAESGRGLQKFSRERKRAQPYEPPFMKS